VLSAISWNLVELHLVLMLGVHSRNDREARSVLLEVWELLVLSDYLGGCVEVLGVLTLSLALIGDGGRS
jgi:hypothetical protein